MPFEKTLLTECPTLHPTDAEFQSPIEYLSRDDVKALGTQYGLLKIVPPVGWKPPFSLAQSFKFHTRTQNLGDLGLRNRSRKFFVENMNRFQQMAGLKPRKPWISGFLKPVHVYDLYLAFKELFPHTTDISTLKTEDALRLNQKLGVDSHTKGLLNAFRDKIWPYARFLASNGDNFDFPSVLSDDPDSCVVCNRNNAPTSTLLCDNCDDAFHMRCLDPPMETIPSGNWYCDKCLVGSGDYGFEEDPELRYSLNQFVYDCSTFEQEFYQKYASSNAPLTIDALEEIFWSIVETGDSSIKVKYGADIHNQTAGEVSGFPTADYPTLPTERTIMVENYAKHPWNLTRLPFAKGSLLNHIKSKISGMTVPWLYVGSLLSTFCWHVEDHYTLSANYCHFGNIKNWYGIPSAYADKFEQHMRSLAPDLFQRQPDLLHQLVTLISPSELVKIGIPAVFARQGPNEFIITFPRVYHAGFNAGFNFNEAVNFSMDSWLPIGEQAVEDYRLIKKESVFDHYTLVENILRAFLNENSELWVHRQELLQVCLNSFLAFLSRQKKFVEQLKSDRFVDCNENGDEHAQQLEHGIKTPQQETLATFEDASTFKTNSQKPLGMKAVANDNDDKLCDICRTFLSYQYCNINNKSHRFGRWNKGRLKKEDEMLTPEASPYVLEHNQKNNNISHNDQDTNIDLNSQSTDVAVEMAKSESGGRLQQISGIGTDGVAVKCESDVFKELVHSAKRKLRSEKPDATPKKKQRPLRSSLAREVTPCKMEESPAPVAQKTPYNSLFRELNQFDNIRLCLQCTIKECGERGEHVPRFSQIIYETNFEDMVSLLNDARRKVMELGK